MSSPTGKIKRYWRIDNEGFIHWPGKKYGQTYCRRPSKGMKKSGDGHLMLNCEACRDLQAIQKDDPWLP